MKCTILLIVVLSVSAWNASAQTDSLSLPTKNGNLFYQWVIHVDSTSKQELFNRGRMWAVDYFNSAKDVLQIKDEKTGQITGKGLFTLASTKYSGPMINTVKFTFNIQYKDGRYRVQFYDFLITSLNPVSGQSITDPMDSVYYHYVDHQEHRMLFESRKKAERRYAGYLYSFIKNIASAEGSLYEYEAGQHKTDF
jgi:hypothetical protein